MKAIALCPRGLEDVLVLEVKELLSKTAESIKGGCIFECSQKELAKFAYFSQSCENVGVLHSEGEFKEVSDMQLGDFDSGLATEELFSVTAEIVGEVDFRSVDVIEVFTNHIKEKTKGIPTYKSATYRFRAYIVDNNYYFYQLLYSKDLIKRDYKIFANKTSLRGTLAYGLIRIAKITEKDTVIDSFCRSGEVLLEAAHYLSHKSIHYYTKDKFLFKALGWDVDLSSLDKVKEEVFNFYAIDSNMANLKATEKNTKIAGLHKQIQFARIPIEDLDLKFENNVDVIVTQLPAVGKEHSQRILGTIQDFFEMAPQLLAKKGKVVCMGVGAQGVVDIGKQAGFKLLEEREVMQGKEVFQLFVFSL